MNVTRLSFHRVRPSGPPETPDATVGGPLEHSLEGAQAVVRAMVQAEWEILILTDSVGDAHGPATQDPKRVVGLFLGAKKTMKRIAALSWGI